MLSFVEQARRWNPDLLDRFRRLVQHPNGELVTVEPTHSFVLLWDVPLLIWRTQHAADRLEKVFGERPRVADTTEMMMSDTTYHALDRAGYEAASFDGRPWIMEWVGRSGSEAEVSAYFTPQEWWALGPDGIVWEIQEVYKQFIAALDAHLPAERAEEPVVRPSAAELSPIGPER